MSTRPFISIAGRLLVGGACLLASASCGSEMLRTGRSPMLLVVEGVNTTAGGNGSGGASLHSDVEPVIDDIVTVTVRSLPKNPDVSTTVINTVSLTRYHLEYRRTDGRNRPGVDVPYGFDGGLSGSIPPNGASDFAFVIVRNQAKLEPPLKNLVSLGGLAIVSTIAEITLYGHDQNGNEISVSARVDVHFTDYADDEDQAN
jgi:hypothetical protein